MEILPAIDLRGGQCVRLRQGATGGSFGPPVTSTSDGGIVPGFP